MSRKKNRRREKPIPSTADGHQVNTGDNRPFWRDGWIVTGIGLVAVVIVAIIWFTVLKYPESADSEVTDTTARQSPDRQDDGPQASLRYQLDLNPLESLERVAFDPSGSGWDSESNSDIAADQLKAIASIVAQPEIDQESLARVVATGFVCGSLRPDQLQVVFQDEAILVKRSPEDTAVDSGSSANYVGRKGLVAALQALRQPFQSSQPLRYETKIFRVTTDGPQLQTRAYFKLIGRATAGILQQSAIWTCQWQRALGEQKLKLKRIDVSAYEETSSQPGDSLLVDCTDSVLGHNESFQTQLLRGLDYWGMRIPMQLGLLDPTGKHGITVGDVNNDGLEDLYVINPAGLPNALFRQNPDGTASDVSKASKVDILDPSTSALLIDVDNDGDQDLVVSTYPGLVFLENDGTGTFSLRSSKSFPMGASYSLAAADYDNDRDLDIYACCYTPIVKEKPQLLGKPVPYHDANNGSMSVLLRNEGDWKFRNVTRQVGMDANNRRFSYAAAWEDYDNDGDQDLYVANDFGRNNLYRNDDGKFEDVAAEAGVEDISAGMSVTWGDYDNDGQMDLYVSNMFSSAGNRIAYQRNFNTQATGQIRSELQRHARGNSLFRNTGEGTFEDVSIDTGVTMGRWAWSSNFVDLNNDGWEDIVVANGFLTNDDTQDL